MLAGTLQNPVVMLAQEVSAVPANLQHKFTYKLYASQTDQANGNPMLDFTEKTSKLVGKRLTLTYVPATQADANTIASYLPQPHANGSPILPSELPTSLPGYLIKLRPQINLDGVSVATTSASVQMGADLYSTGGFTQLYDPGQWDLTSEESNVAGQATAIGISAGGISAAQMAALRDRLISIQAKLRAKDFTGLTGEQISGEVLSATIWTWFAAAESHNSIAKDQSGIVENPGLSYGLFHAIAKPQYSWGVIRRVTFPGVNMDIGHVRNLAWAKDSNEQSWVDYNRRRGMYMSGLEASVPVLMLSDPSWCNLPGTSTQNTALQACPKGASATRLIAVASEAGQKIFTITAQVFRGNPNIVATNLSTHSVSTKERIQQALEAGYEVTIHEAPIAQDGWVGAGFTVIDPASGAGGYLIDGGTNGAVIVIPPGTPLCEGFWSALWTNFVSTNTIIPGLALPTGVTLFTGQFVVDSLGGITLLKLALNWTALVEAGIAGGATVIALVVAAINFVLLSLAFEIGIFIGSAVAASETCRRP